MGNAGAFSDGALLLVCCGSQPDLPGRNPSSALAVASADADLAQNTMVPAAGFALPQRAPLLHFARCQEVLAWAPEIASKAGEKQVHAELANANTRRSA